MATEVTMRQLQAIAELRPIDDILFEVLASNKLVCQEILRVILDDDNLIVSTVNPQEDIRNLLGRSVRLDAKCILGDGRIINIEIQKEDNDDHVKRVRYNAACITVNETEKGTKFQDIAAVKVVYISRFDPLKVGLVIYHLRTSIMETMQPVDDGQEIIMVNCAVKDASTVSRLMECFLQKQVDNPLFPELSKQMNYLKNTEGGHEVMCEIMEKYMEAELAEERKKYEKAVTEEREKSIIFMLNNGISEAIVMKEYHLTKEDLDVLLKRVPAMA